MFSPRGDRVPSLKIMRFMYYIYIIYICIYTVLSSIYSTDIYINIYIHIYSIYIIYIHKYIYIYLIIFFNKIVGIKVSRAYFLTICVIIFQHTGRTFIRYYALYIYK